MSAQPGNTTPVIRVMKPTDLDAVALIEARNYEFPWSRGIFSDCLMAGYFCIVLDDGNSLLGYSIVSSAVQEGHILNLCIDKDCRRQGYGQQMLDYLLEYAADTTTERLFLEVRPSNSAAIQLYEGAGFAHLGIRKAYYRAHDGREDALVLVKDIL
ncbi:MAG: ribosomal protein S18-alanine N-acetyltransferase [Gammaproteobacteria bacterium]